ncbi:hypothetical protein EPO17_03260 [Patescibacteria group bacterium]|nr:MAG: hypothetical protein EPO17_03260 [Patescibacteria group bacterium]
MHKKDFQQKMLPIALFAIIVGIGIHVEQKRIAGEQEIQNTLIAQQKILNQYAQDITALKSGVIAQNKKVTEVENTFSKNNQLLTEKLKKAEEESKLSGIDANQKILAIETSLANVPKSLISVIQEWKPRVAKINCIWKNTSGRIYATGGGSGFIFRENIDKVEHIWVLTNKHVFLDDGRYTPYSCSIKLPGDETIFEVFFSSGSYRTIDPLDVGLIEIVNPDAYVKSITAIKKVFTESFCSYTPSLGEKVAILGYPVIGTVGDITATEGIISGYDSDYYITSAKIEHGNSGGIALSIEKNCILGIPTFVRKGEIETLGRILSAQAIFTRWGVPLNQ